MALKRGRGVLAGALLVALATCGDSVPPLQTADPGVVFTFPIDGQVDVPSGARILVTFSDPVTASAVGTCTGSATSVIGAFCLVGPNGPIDAEPVITGEGKTIAFPSVALEPGATYAVYARSVLAPSAKNLPASGPLFSFTARTARPRAAAPTLVAVNGGQPAMPTSFRPMFETSTIRLLFSEPLDPRTITLATGALELVDMGTGAAVPATLLSDGIHVSLDPITDLAPGSTYELRVGSRLLDLSGQTVTPTTVALTPLNSRGANPIAELLRTRGKTDPGPATSRAGAERNVIEIDKPLIGRETSEVLPSTLAAELGDPKALGGPIAFTIRRGQRLRASGLDVKLGGQIPVGLTTGDIQIELISDGGGRIYRNKYQPAEQRPENDRAPLYCDLSMDVAVYAVDPTGNAVLTQTVLGVQATGTAVATDGVLAIENVATMELGLLGVTAAPTNFVLELITDPASPVTTDTTAPMLLSTSPGTGTSEHPVDAGIELIFDEPVDLDRLRAGGVRLETTAGAAVASVIESHGAAVVIRPLVPLAYTTLYRVVLSDVADVAGNKLAAMTMGFTTPALVTTNAPMTVVALHPGVPCVLAGATATSPGRCAGGATGDDLYHPFTMPANEAIDVAFSQPVRRNTVARGVACNQGSVRIEEVDAAGACTAVVAGSLIVRDRALTFIPDAPWTDGKKYKLTLVSGANAGCDAGELCGSNSVAANFDPLNGTGNGDAGGSPLVIPFTGSAVATSTFMLAAAAPFSDVNGSGVRETSELEREDNRAALAITGTTGNISSARFNGTDCLPGMSGTQACMYLQGAMPVEMGEVEMGCALPDGTTAPACVPVTLGAQAMYATSLSMTATLVIGIDADTGTSVMRVREPSGGPVKGFIIDKAGVPTLVTALDLYMDAPDMSLPLGSSHDLHSKRLTMTLEGPLTFLPDGRISIAVTNTAALPVVVKIDGPLGLGGDVQMSLPAGEMKLTLVSPLLRGGAR